MHVNEAYEWFSPLLKKAVKAKLKDFWWTGNHGSKEKYFGDVQINSKEEILWLIKQYPGCRVVENWNKECGWYDYFVTFKHGSIKIYAVRDRVDLTPSPAPNYTFKKWNGVK